MWLPPHPDATGPLAPWDLTETESDARIVRYRQNLLSAPRTYPFPHPDAPRPPVPWDLTETESDAWIMRKGQNRHTLLIAPRTCPFSGVQTAARVPPYLDAPGTMVPWHPTETESEAWIMGYGSLFAAPEAVRYSHPGYPPAGRTLLNPTERIRRLRSRPAVPPGA